VDAVSPGIDGLDICRRIKSSEQTARVAVALVSGENFSPHDHAAGIAAGADDFIWRPFREEEFLTRVQSLLRIQRTEERLRRALDEAREIIARSPVVVFRWRNAEGWPVEFVSPNVVDLFGYDAEKFLSGEVTYASVVHRDDLDRVSGEVQENSKDPTRGSFVHQPYRILAKNGEIRWVDDRTTIQRDETGHVVHYQGIVLDVTDRIAMELELRESRRQMAALFGNLPGMAYRCRNDCDWTVEFLSDSCEKVTGYMPADLVDNAKLSYNELIHPDDREYVWKSVQEAVAQQRQYELEYRIITASGEERWVWEQGMGVAVDSSEQVTLEGYITDSTDRKKAEESLKAAAREKAIILSALSELVVLHDPDFRVVWANRAAYESVTAQEGELAGRHCFAVWQNRMDPCPGCPVLKAFETGMAHEAEMETEDGRWWQVKGYPVKNEAGDVINVVEVCLNITEQVVTSQALKDSEHRYRVLLDNIDLGISLIGPTADVLSANQQMREWFPDVDSSKRPISHRVFEDLPVKEVRAHGPVHLTLSDGRTHETEAEARTENGIKQFRIVATPLKDSEGQITGAIEMIEDITERIQAEREQESLREQLALSQKLEAVGRLAGGVAHDFNNMLTVISNYASIIQQSLSKFDPMRNDIAEIGRAAKRATDLTRQLLAFSRKQIIEPKVININESISQSEKMLRRIIGEDIELAFLPDEDLKQTKADPGQVEQIFFNLAVNARDAMEDGGKLTIETSNAVLDEKYKLSHDTILPGAYVMLAISDSGCGMAAEVRERVFEPFFTTKATGQGTGLGLSTVYGIVKQHGGFIEVYSEPDMGTTFKIFLPAADAEAEVLAEPAPTGRLQGSETLILVEDDNDVRKVAKRILEAQGYSIIESSNGNDAILKCKGHSGTIELLLTDVVMPGMSGRECYDALRDIRPDLKVLYMTGYTEDAIASKGILEYGVQLIQKPFTIEALAGKVRQILDEK